MLLKYVTLTYFLHIVIVAVSYVLKYNLLIIQAFGSFISLT